MRSSRKLGLVLATAGAVGALGVPQVSAQTVEVPVPAPVAAGALTITPPAGTQTGSVSGSTATITLPHTQVADSRTLNGTPALSGWTATVTVSGALTASGGGTIPASRMTWTTNDREKNTLGVWAVTADFTGGSGTMSSPVVAARANNGAGFGTYRYNATVSIDVSGIAEGTYTGTLEQTVS